MIKAILQKIKENNSIVIFGHINPDGDCYGSQIALRRAIQLKYPEKKVYALGSGLHRFFEQLGCMDVVPEKVIEQSLAIIVDGNDLPRMEDQRVKFAKDFIKFDHHVDTGSFTEGPELVNEDASSCCEILFDFFKQYDFPIDELVAQALFLGIITDTNRFQFITDYEKVFSDASELVKLGAKPKALNVILTQTTERAMEFKGYVYSHYQKTNNGVLYLVMNRKQIHKFKLTANAASGMVNLISNVRGCPIWAFFCENNNGTMHIEFRSNGPAVQPLALSLGGGGHRRAAGVTITDPTQEKIDSIIKDLDEIARKWKEENE